MRTATPIRLLLLPAALLAAACDDMPSPHEPPVAEEAPAREAGEPTHQDGVSLLDQSHWADGYLLDGSPLTDSVNLSGTHFAFNRSGGAITVTKPAGTTGRYVVTFSGLSGLLGGRSAVHVNQYGFDDTYCKPVGARLVSDKVEVRCFKASTRAAANAGFTLLVTRDYANRAFAYAHQPTATDYSPNAQGSWNPAGSSRVFRSGVGKYRVVFKGLGAQLPPNAAGHVQVNAVGTGKAHCKPQEFGGTPDLGISVRCFSAAGALVDSKFTVLFLLPASHLA